MGNWIRFRLGFVYVSFVLFFSLVALRLVQLQVWGNPELDEIAKKQFTRVGRRSPYRMPVYDRNGEELAVSLPSSSVFARPKLIRARKKVARGLSQVFGGTPTKWLERLDPKKSFVWIERQVNEEAASKLLGLKLPGIFVESENRRIYPNGTLAASIIGFTDIDGNGISGIEHRLNRELLSSASKIRFPRDGKGNPSYIDKRLAAEEKRPAVYLTLDRRIQHILEEELTNVEKETGAKAVMAAVMDPHTGEIFAMGQTPAFDPNQPKDYAADTYVNRMVSHLYEPGSTMKVLLAAEAIELGLYSKQTPIHCGNGKIKIADRTITEADSKHKWGLIPLEEVIRYSSNVGSVKIAQSLGADRIKAMIQKYRMAAKTQIELPGEAVAPSKLQGKWKPILLANVGFGQGISMTPLQMMVSFAPFANGGYWVRPRILPGELTNESKIRVISEKTAKTMNDILVSVVHGKNGTGASAQIPGIEVAGKTGTAQKYEAGAGYASQKYFSSFIGFLPAKKPELLVAVMVDEPKRGYYASEVAAPVFKRIAERSLQILNRTPREIARGEAKLSVAKTALKLEVSESGKLLMPDLKGISMKEAVTLLSKYSENLTLVGDGYLIAQHPAPGTVLSDTEPISLNFSLPD